MREYSVYIHTSPNGKVYIGLTSMQPKDRWDCGHGYKNNKHFTSAIKKYGWENFKHEVVVSGLTAEQAGELEQILICEYNACNSQYGYNEREGGTFGFHFNHTDEVKMKISESSKRQWENPERHRVATERYSGENNPFYGKTHSQETLERIKVTKSSNPRNAEIAHERGVEMGKSWKGKTRSSESVAKSAKAKWKPVEQYTKDGVYIRTWDSAKEACETLHIHKTTLCQCCKGIKPSAGGFIWKYKDNQQTG